MTFPADCVLHRAAPSDLAAYGAFLRGAFEATYGPHQAADRMARHLADRFTDDALRQEVVDPVRTLLLLERDGSLAAIALLRAGPAPASVDAGRPVEIERFYVGAEWHGTGLAAPLMDAALQSAREAAHDVAWLGVWEHNARAIRFYEKRGFRIVGRQAYLFDGEPEDDHVMARAL